MSDNLLNNDSVVIKPVIPDVPTINPNAALPPFKAWVQMAIPTVYDDSLSYAELLYKVINYLNVTNEHLTNNDNIIKQLSDYMCEEVSVIKNWFNDLVVDDEIDRKVQEVLDLWATPYNPEIPDSGKLYNMFIADVQEQVATGLDSWIDEHLDPISGYVLDSSLTLKNAASPASMLGTSLNNIGIVAFDEILNMRLGANGIGYVVEDNSLIYRFLLINQAYNKIIIYPNNLENVYIRYAIKSAKSGDQSALLHTERYPAGTGYGTLSQPIEIDFSAYKNNGDIYFECSVSKQTGTLPIDSNKASLSFRYADSVLDYIIKNETEDTITEEDLNNAIVNTGFISFSDDVQSGRLHATDGTKVTDENSLLYGYAELSDKYNKIVVWSKEPAINIRVAFYSVSGNNQSFIRNTRIDITDKPSVITYDYSNDEKFMRISVTCDHTLDPITDKDILVVANADNAYYEQNGFYLKNYNKALVYTTTDGYLITASGTINASTSFNYKSLNVRPFTNYLFVFNPTAATQTIRIHGYYNDNENETWIQQLHNFVANTYTEPFIINSQSSNVIKVSMPNSVTGFEMFEVNNFVLNASKSISYNPLSSYVYSGAKVSILGASISSFEGTIPDGFSAYYPHEVLSQSQNPVKVINDMYWKKFIDIIGGELLINNSSAGRPCSMGVEAQRPRAACGTWCTELHTDSADPDIIIIQVGGNDFTNGVVLGDYIGTTALPTDDSGSEDPVITSIFSNAYAIMLAKILTRYPKAKVICGTIPPVRAGSDVITDSFPIRRTSDNVTLTEFNERIRTLARAFGCYVAEFYGNGRTYQNIYDYCQDDVQHPSREGHSLMCNALLNTLGQQNLNYFNV